METKHSYGFVIHTVGEGGQDLLQKYIVTHLNITFAVPVCKSITFPIPNHY